MYIHVYLDECFFQGSRFKNGFERSDYSVAIGHGTCTILDVTDNVITCAPPDELHEDDLNNRKKRNAGDDQTFVIHNLEVRNSPKKKKAVKDPILDNQEHISGWKKKDVPVGSYSEADIPKSRQKRAVRQIDVSLFAKN